MARHDDGSRKQYSKQATVLWAEDNNIIIVMAKRRKLDRYW